MNSKKIVRDGLVGALRPIKRVVQKHPKAKRVVRNLIAEHMSLGSTHHVSHYQRWLERHYPDAIVLRAAAAEQEHFTYRPKISILTPTYNTDLEHLVDCITSVQAQLYDNWELCIVDDASPDKAVRDTIAKLAKEDPRIVYKFRTKNGHISAATNDALSIASGEFIGLLDHDDVLWPNALFEVVKALNTDKNIDFLYSDEDKIRYTRHDHSNPFFKPDWNPEFLESVNYITHFAVLRKTLIKKVGGFRSEYNGAQDWDLFLRAAYACRRIYHIPTVLYSWRMSETSTALETGAKPYVTAAQKHAMEISLQARGENAKVTMGRAKDYWTVRYAISGTPKISIVIPTKDQYAVVKRCIDSIYRKTSYKNFEVILVDTGSVDRKVRRWYKQAQRQHNNLTVLDWPEQPFSYSRSCNHGAQHATGEFLVMLNNDTEVLTPTWLELLLSDAQRKGIGAVGCLLYYPDGKRIQHAGIGVGLGGLAANLLSLVPKNQLDPLQHLYALTRHEVTAVTAACLMVKKDRFAAVRGFDEAFRITYNDVDFCLKLREAGLRNIYNPAVELLHHESISVGLPDEKKKRDTKEFVDAKHLFTKHWQEMIDHDPNLNPNISRSNALFEINDK